jgi:hypothetical protein
MIIPEFQTVKWKKKNCVIPMAVAEGGHYSMPD